MATVVEGSVRSGTSFAADELDFVVAADGLAISVQGGRAWSNNGALLAVLAAAASPTVDWLFLIVPIAYKGSPQLSRVIEPLQELRESPGVRLDVRGVGLFGY